jgi:ATP-dependent RNA helicase DDX54/DBP10
VLRLGAGSGKTAAFLIPMVERLKQRAGGGVRGLVLAPTRELAVQTFRVFGQLARFTDLVACALVGGESMEAQFEALSRAPDVLVATPGRLLHHLVEVDLSLASVQLCVFDEADRLFEMGFAAQLHEILRRLSSRRQTALVSATMPAALAEFARAGLRDPVIARLDVESKLSPLLSLSFLATRPEDKLPALLHLLLQVLPHEQQALVFAATRYMCEYVQQVLEGAGVSAACIFGEMLPELRRANVLRFRGGKTRVLVVTDLAARGLDIPRLDNVINLDFPPKPKLFVHRVGRVARAGRAGAAISLVARDELAYLLDLEVFLGARIVAAGAEDAAAAAAARAARERSEAEEELREWAPTAAAPAAAAAAAAAASVSSRLATDDALAALAGAGAGGGSSGPGELVFGAAPMAALQGATALYRSLQSDSLLQLGAVCQRAHRLYVRTRPQPSAAAVRRAKAMPPPRAHPLFASAAESPELAALLEQVARFRGRQTIFELLDSTRGRAAVMRAKRDAHERLIAARARAGEGRGAAAGKEEAGEEEKGDEAEEEDEEEDGEEKDGEEEAAAGGGAPTDAPSRAHDAAKAAAAAARRFRDERFYVSATPPARADDRGLEVSGSARDRAALDSLVMDVGGDDTRSMQRRRSAAVWDRKRKRFVGLAGADEGALKRLKLTNESGVAVRLGAVAKSGLYEQWRKRTRKAVAAGDGGGDGGDSGGGSEGEWAGEPLRAPPGPKQDYRAARGGGGRGGGRGGGGGRGRGGGRGGGFGGRGRGGGGRSGRSELRSPQEVRKLRAEQKRLAAKNRPRRAREGAAARR